MDVKGMSSSRSHKKYTVRLGGKSLYPNSTTTLVVPVEDIVCHRSFDATTLRHDIALVLLAFAVNYSSYIQPVCLPEKACQAETGTECWVTGWGHLAEGETDRWGAEGAVWCPGVGPQLEGGTGRLIFSQEKDVLPGSN